MNHRQEQRVGQGGQAIQAGQNVTINQGATVTEIAEILARNAQIIEQYRYEAREEARVRFQDFEDRVQKKFSELEAADSTAFRKPGFQFAVRGAQEAFVRSGEKEVGDVLVDLLARRSKEEERGIAALVMDEAIEVSGKLSRTELSLMAATFVVLSTRVSASGSADLISQLSAIFRPVAAGLPSGRATASYLVGLGCMQYEAAVTRPFHEILILNYGYLLNHGFSRAEFDRAVGAVVEDALWARLVRPLGERLPRVETASFLSERSSYAPRHPDQRFVLRGQTEDEFEKIIQPLALDADLKAAAMALARSKCWTEDYTVSHLRPLVPDIDRLKSLFVVSSVGQLNVTVKGLALAHAYLSSIVPSFRTPLSTWIN